MAAGHKQRECRRCRRRCRCRHRAGFARRPAGRCVTGIALPCVCCPSPAACLPGDLVLAGHCVGWPAEAAARLPMHLQVLGERGAAARSLGLAAVGQLTAQAQQHGAASPRSPIHQAQRTPCKSIEAMPGPSVAASTRTACLLRALPAVAARRPSIRSRRAGLITSAAGGRASSSCGVMAAAAAAGDGAAAAAAAPPLPAPATLWQRITERYDAAQRDAAATMTETNTGKWQAASRLWQARHAAAKSRAGACLQVCFRPLLQTPALLLPQSWCPMAACSLCCAWQPSCGTSPSRRPMRAVRRASAVQAVLGWIASLLLLSWLLLRAACSVLPRPAHILTPACRAALHCRRRGKEGVAQPIPAVRPCAVGGGPGRCVPAVLPRSGLLLQCAASLVHAARSVSVIHCCCRWRPPQT